MTIEITLEQQRVIERTERLLGVRGCAGSGKSLVAMLRAVHQLARAGHEDARVLVLTFNRPLVSYLRGLLRQDDFAYPPTTLDQIQLPTNLAEWDFDGRIHVDNYDRFGHELLHGASIELVTDKVKIDAALERAAERSALGRSPSAQLASRVRRLGMYGAATIEEADEFVPGFRMLQSRQSTWDMRAAWVAEMEETSTVHGWGELALALRRAIERGRIVGAHRYDHLILDEIQDFTPAWLRVARRYLVADGGSITAVGDAAQTLYPRLGRRANLPRTELGFPRANSEDAAIVSLGKASYRMSKDPAARGLARWWHTQRLAPQLDGDARDGHMSLLSGNVRQTIHTFDDHGDSALQAESDAVMQRAKRLVKSGSVAVLLPAAKSLESINIRWKTAIASAGVDVRVLQQETRRSNSVVSFWGEDSRACVWFVSYRHAKGAEWDYVFVPRLSDWCLSRELDGFHTLVEQAIHETGAADPVPILDEALYVSMTRARKGLYLSAPFRVSSMFDGAPVDIRRV